MEFCEICDNMLFITSREEDGVAKLMHLCRKCGNEKQIHASVVSSMTFTKKEQYSSVINKYTKLDPTLPRINSIPCPKAGCVNNTQPNPEIIYVRYDNVDLKYAYLCPECDTIWKTDKN